MSAAMTEGRVLRVSVQIACSSELMGVGFAACQARLLCTLPSLSTEYTVKGILSLCFGSARSNDETTFEILPYNYILIVYYIYIY